MSSHLDVLGTTGLAIVSLMVAVWLLSLVLGNASIVDIAWGFGFVVVAAVSAIVGDGNDERSTLLVVLVGIWGLRLSGYLLWRNWGEPEDFRYQSMRRRQGPKFPIKSLLTVFALQGAVMFIVSLPVQLAMTPTTPDLGVLAAIGVLLWAVGLFFETVGDVQLARFKAQPDNAGKVLQQGLWRFTRHPNYFGDFCVWWGIWLVTAESGDAAWAVIGPVLMSVMLLRVSGVPMLERSLTKRRPDYVDYITRTSAFFPRRPRSTTH